jgi:hypothetical protein
MRLYRALSSQELTDISQTGGFRPGPPSFQGKWFAETHEHAAAWGRLFYLTSGPPFRLVVTDIPDSVAALMFLLSFLDGIGPARFADSTMINLINLANTGIVEVPAIALGRP